MNWFHRLYYRFCYRFFPRPMARRDWAAAQRRHEAWLAENPWYAKWVEDDKRFEPYRRAFSQAVPVIRGRFEAEADKLIDPAIYFNADTGAVRIVERIQLIEHFGAEAVRPRGEDPDETLALVIQGPDMVMARRASDPRTHPDGWPWSA